MDDNTPETEGLKKRRNWAKWNCRLHMIAIPIAIYFTHGELIAGQPVKALVILWQSFILLDFLIRYREKSNRVIIICILLLLVMIGLSSYLLLNYEIIKEKYRQSIVSICSLLGLLVRHVDE